MKVAYSLLVDEYVDATVVEQSDCAALRLRCPVCLEPVAVAAGPGTAVFCHKAPPATAQLPQCESQSAGFTGEYCSQHNARARKQRLKFLRSLMFKELLAKDPFAPYTKHIWEETPRLRDMGALSWLPQWHWGFLAEVAPKRFKDSLAFFMHAESYLRSADRQFPGVPKSGYRRQVHIQAAFDLFQYLVKREDLGDDYEWLFLHAFRISLGRWVGGSRTEPEDEARMESASKEDRERVAAARILSCCALDLMSENEPTVNKAIETLNEEWIGPPVLSEPIPFAAFLAAEVAGEMQSTLYRLPYLPLLGEYTRPCQPTIN